MQNKNIDRLPKRWTWRKPKGKPKRPLSAYNIFFADVRQELLTERTNNRGIGFRNLAQAVAERWKELDPVLKEPYMQKAKLAMARYKEELSLWEETRTGMKKCVVIPDGENEVIRVTVPPTETSIASRSLANYDYYNGMIPSILPARYCPLSNISSSATSSCHTSSWTTEQIPVCAHISNDDYNASIQSFLNLPYQSACHHVDGTAQTCVTPTSIARRALTSNDEVQSNMTYDHTYEPFPILYTSENNCYDTFGNLNYSIGEFNGGNRPNFDAEILRATVAHDQNQNESTFDCNDVINESVNNEQYDPIEPMRFPLNDNDTYNLTYLSPQLEAYFKSMEH